MRQCDQLHTVTQEAFNKVCPPTAIIFNQTINGTLEQSDCLTNFENRNTVIDRYTLRGYAKQQVAFTLGWVTEAIAFTIYSPQGKPIYYAGSIWEVGKSLRLPTTGYYDLPEDGIYTVEIRTVNPPVNPSAQYSFNAEALGGQNCVYALNIIERTANVAGSSFEVNLTGTAGCPWTASSDANWVSFPGGATGTGGKAITVQVAANTGAPRETVVRIAGRSFIIYQDAPCNYVGFLDEKGVAQSAFYTFWGLGGGGFRSLSVVTGNNCPLTAKSNTPWITILNTVGKNVFMTIGENPGPIRRGEIEVSGLKIAVVQGAGNLAIVSGADFSNRVSRQGIISIFGEELATEAKGTTELPLQFSLGDVVSVRLFHHRSGNNYYTSLFYVSPTQINVLLPDYMLDEGPTRLEVYRKNGLISRGEFVISRLAPALFSADSSGSGTAAANIQRVKANGEQTYEDVAGVDAMGKVIARPIDLSVSDENVYLILYGVGTRLRSDVKNVTCEIDGQPLLVDYAGPQGFYVGVDQINVLLPKSLRGKGEVTVRLKVDDQLSNTVKIQVAP